MLNFSKSLLSVMALSGAAEAKMREKDVKEILTSSDKFDDNLIKQLLVRHDLNHLMLSDVNKLMMRIAQEFPEIATLSTIGASFEGRPMYMLTIDAKSDVPLNNKPGMFLSGAHHAREFMSTQMPLYSVLRMIHGGYIHNDDKYKNMLTQNKYYVVPVVNVDGLADIESNFDKTGKVQTRRKNMNNQFGSKCQGEDMGVDLNRNYAVFWDKPGGSSTEPCEQSYRGSAPFSEPETRAIRDFLRSHKDDVKFAYNFHSYGNMYLWPYNGSSPNVIGKQDPEALNVFTEIWNQSTFPSGTIHGNAWEALKYTSSGEQSDWILGELGIPSICPEIGSSDFFSYMWNIPFRRVVSNVLEENLNWLENTYTKIGNQISVNPVGYKKLGNNQVLLYVNIQNDGLSDQMIPKHQVKLGDNVSLLGTKKAFTVSNLKKRSHQIETVPVELKDQGQINLMNNGGNITIEASQPEYLQSTTWGQPKTMEFAPIEQNITALNSLLIPKTEQKRDLPDWSASNHVRNVTSDEINNHLAATPSKILQTLQDPGQNSMYLIMD